MQGTKKNHISKCVHDAMLELFDPCIYLDELPAAQSFLNKIRCVETTKSVLPAQVSLSTHTWCARQFLFFSASPGQLWRRKRKMKKTLGGRGEKGGHSCMLMTNREKWGKTLQRGDKTTLNFLTLDACTSSVHCCFLTGVGGRCCCWSPISFLDSRDGDGGHNYIPRIIKALPLPLNRPKRISCVRKAAASGQRLILFSFQNNKGKKVTLFVCCLSSVVYQLMCRGNHSCGLAV